MKQALVLLAPLLMGACEAADRPGGAKSRIPSLPPSAFSELPAPIAGYLNRRGCQIPQSLVEQQPHNVISGAFFGPGSRDWALFCLANGTSTLLVFKQGASTPAATLRQFDERSVLPADGSAGVEFPYRISPVGKGEILYYYDAFGGDFPSRIDHQGIDDYFDGKASVIHYYHDGRWLELTGMD